MAVKLYVTNKTKHRTSVKGNTLNPTWNEEFEFIIFDKQHQIVHFELLDSDPFSPDDLFGEVALDLATLNLAAGHINELQLPVHRIGTKYTKKKKKRFVRCLN
jgi:Ca2+-dependent lipid-binding protein